MTIIIKKIINENNSSENSDQMNYNTSEERCHLKHISKIGKSDKIEILRYYNSIPNESQKTEYLKSMITEIDIIQRSGSIKPRQSNYEYFVNLYYNKSYKEYIILL
jgi:hypothetical protein